MKKLILLPTALILLIIISGCQSTLIEGADRATFDGKETAIVASR